MSGGIFQVFRWVPFKRCQDVLCIGNLFGGGEQGAWYDPSDLSTLFQDAAGTVPVTAMEQPVGRMLDKSGRGNHAFQATTTKRGVVSRRVNLWQSTENLSSVWGFNGSTVTAAGTAPTGSAAWLMSDSAVSSAHRVSQSVSAITGRHTVRLLAKPQGGRYVLLQVGNGFDRGNAVFDLQTGAVTDSTSDGLGAVSFSIVPLSDGWFMLSASAMNDAGNRASWFGISSGPTIADSNFLGDDTRTILFAEPSLHLATDAHLPYQWVNTYTDYDADLNKFPTYLRFDGVDDAYQTNSIDFTGTDKMTVWAGVTKLSDAVPSIVAELSSSIANNGAFSMSAPASTNNLQFSSKGTVANSATFANVGPSSQVMTGSSSISAPSIALRINGTQVDANAVTQGTGNYGNYPLYTGAREGTSRFFNGRLYGLIVAGANYPLSQLEAAELYIKHKMRMP